MSTSARPELRASMLKQTLRGLDSFNPDDRRKIRSVIDPRLITEIETATLVSWLPVEYQTMILDATLTVVGADRAVAVWRGVVREFLDSTTLGPVIHGAVRVFGLSPAPILRRSSHTHTLLFRNAGTIRVEEPEPTKFLVIYEGAPVAYVGAPSWALSTSMGYEVILKLTRRTGNVVLSDYQPTRGSGTFMITWDP